MHAFIVSAKWLDWVAKRNNSFAEFLTEVGTPSILQDVGSLDTSFNGVAGFFIKIPDNKGWSIRFDASLGQRSLQAVDEIAVRVSEMSV